MKKKILIVIVILILGIISLSTGIILSLNNNSNHLENIENETNKKEDNIYQDSEVIIFNYQEKETSKDIKSSFIIYNNSDMIFENTSLFIEFYNGDELLYTKEIDVDKLDIKEQYQVNDAKIVFIYDKITNRKFKFIGKYMPNTNLDDYIKKFGTIDANQNKSEEAIE